MALSIKSVHHIAIICSDYKSSLAFYCDTLGFELLSETYREARDSYKADLAIAGQYVIELFSFSSPPKRPSYPEAAGLRHLAFTVEDVSEAVERLAEQGIACEAIRTDELTGKRFTFTADPDGLPIEFYEI